MTDFSCAAAGADSCGWTVSASSEEEMLNKIEHHLKTKHDVAHVTPTLKKYAQAVMRGEL